MTNEVQLFPFQVGVPPGVRFFDINSGRDMVYVDGDFQSWKGWLFFLNVDGQWVSLRQATEADLEAIEAAKVRRQTYLETMLEAYCEKK